MGNHRHVNCRPGPSARRRAEDVAAAEEHTTRVELEANAMLQRQQQDRERSRRDLSEERDAQRELERRAYNKDMQSSYRRNRKRLLAKEAKLEEVFHCVKVRDEVVNLQVAREVSRIARFINSKLRQFCRGPRNPEAVMERVMGSPFVFPHLPSYYMKPSEAKISAKLVDNLKEELRQVKGIQSAEMLAYKGALLNAVVGGEIQSGRYSRILNTSTSNLRQAALRRQSLVSQGLSLWRLPARRQQSDVLSATTVAGVLDWWTTQTRVSPNKDIVRNRLAAKEYDEHPTHFLTETQGFTPKEHIVFSDGCTGQFKGCRGMYFVARFPGLTGRCRMRWEYFGTAHGKGEWDGAGAVIKSKLRQEQIRNPSRRLQNVEDVVSFLQEALSSRVDSSYMKKKDPIFRILWYIVDDDSYRRKKWECDTIPGSSKFHLIASVSAADPTKLMVRDLSCFCVPCQMCDGDACENHGHVIPWRLIKIKSARPSDVREQMEQFGDGTESQYGGDGDELSDVVEIGNNFAVPAEGVEFNVLQCQHRKFLVREPFTCRWGPKFEASDYAVVGTYYQKWGNKEESYVFLNESRTAYISAAFVVQVKFSMRPQDHRVWGNDPVYYLSPEDRATIMAQIQ